MEENVGTSKRKVIKKNFTGTQSRIFAITKTKILKHLTDSVWCVLFEVRPID